VVLVDDSRQDRLLLRTMLARLPDVVIAGEAGDLRTAQPLVDDPSVDAVFLDIELGRESGFSLLRRPGRLPHVIFTTVHREYALASYEVSAVDYLVKPVREERLVRALIRLDVLLGRTTGTRITVERSGSDRQLLALDTILAVSGDGKYTRVLAGAETYCDRRSLREWAALLEGGGSERLDRSTLVRMAAILSVKTSGRGARVAFRNSPLVLDLGRAAAERLAHLLNARSAEREAGRQNEKPPANHANGRE
jgi:two-component system LytT family response regulator